MNLWTKRSMPEAQMERARLRYGAEPAHAMQGGLGDIAWWHEMGYEGGPPRSLEQMERQFRRLIASAHPDRGGDAQRMQRLLRARALARVQLTP
jgi:hypothetical protein